MPQEFQKSPGKLRFEGTINDLLSHDEVMVLRSVLCASARDIFSSPSSCFRRYGYAKRPLHATAGMQALVTPLQRCRASLAAPRPEALMPTACTGGFSCCTIVEWTTSPPPTTVSSARPSPASPTPGTAQAPRHPPTHISGKQFFPAQRR